MKIPRLPRDSARSPKPPKRHKRAPSNNARMPTTVMEMPEWKRGPKSTYTEEIGAEICARIAAGENINGICRDKAAGMPDEKTFRVWLLRFPEFEKAYIAATADRADLLAERITDAVDAEPERITTTRTANDGQTIEREQIDPAWVNLQRVKIDTLKWVASKHKPHRYGDRVTLEGGDKPITVHLSQADSDL